MYSSLPFTCGCELLAKVCVHLSECSITSSPGSACLVCLSYVPNFGWCKDGSLLLLSDWPMWKKTFLVALISKKVFFPHTNITWFCNGRIRLLLLASHHCPLYIIQSSVTLTRLDWICLSIQFRLHLLQYLLMWYTKLTIVIHVPTKIDVAIRQCQHTSLCGAFHPCLYTSSALSTNSS